MRNFALTTQNANIDVEKMGFNHNNNAPFLCILSAGVVDRVYRIEIDCAAHHRFFLAAIIADRRYCQSGTLVDLTVLICCINP